LTGSYWVYVYEDEASRISIEKDCPLEPAVAKYISGNNISATIQYPKTPSSILNSIQLAMDGL
jgi:hypothetical protein